MLVTVRKFFVIVDSSDTIVTKKHLKKKKNTQNTTELTKNGDTTETDNTYSLKYENNIEFFFQIQKPQQLTRENIFYF